MKTRKIVRNEAIAANASKARLDLSGMGPGYRETYGRDVRLALFILQRLANLDRLDAYRVPELASMIERFKQTDTQQ